MNESSEVIFIGFGRCVLYKFWWHKEVSVSIPIHLIQVYIYILYILYSGYLENLLHFWDLAHWEAELLFVDEYSSFKKFKVD